MSKNNFSGNDHPLADMSWWVPIGIGLFMPTIGIILGVLKLIDRKSKRDEEEARLNWARRTVSTSSRVNPRYTGQYTVHTEYTTENGRTTTARYTTGAQSAGQTGAQSGAQNGTYRYNAPYRPKYEPIANASSKTPAQAAQAAESASSKNARRMRIAKIALLISAIIFGLAGISGLTEGIRDLMWGFSWAFSEEILPAIFSLITAAGSGVGLAYLQKWQHRTRILKRIVGKRDYMSIRELSEAAGWDFEQTIKVVKQAIVNGKFGPDAYIDMRTVTLVVRGEGPAPKPAVKQEEKPEERTVDEYQDILRQLREVNALIPGEEMTAKINRLEASAAHIFDLIRKEPKRRSQLNRFMDYYLPTSLKLLQTYAQLDGEGLSGENIDATKKSIEDTMDLLVTAFNNQLDKMYESDAMDVSSDIGALKSMLSMDGLDGESILNGGNS